jgi:hypothetical protein
VQEKRNQPVLSSLDWLLGTWKLKSDKVILFEKWTRTNDSSFAGINYRIMKQDTIVNEHVTLQSNGPYIYYIPTVSDQNNALPILFNMVYHAADSIVFENKDHEFPQHIRYKKITNQEIRASIDGTLNGKFKKIDYPFVRK